MIRKSELILLAAALAVMGAIGFNWALKGAIHYQKDVIVPDLQGKPLLEALSLLSQHNLGLKQDGAEFNDTLPAGTVLRQQPAAGMSVREGRIIRATLSQGGETVFVPDLVGQSLRAAEILLRTHFLALGEITEQPSIKYEKDFVVSQSPAASQILAKNSFVRLVISKGAPEDGTILMPDFAGKPRQAALDWSAQTGIKVQFSEEPAPSQPGTILRQEIAPDSQVAPGSEVRIIAASGKSDTFTPSEAAPLRTFSYEAPQGGSAKQYVFILADAQGSREIYRGLLEPGTKHRIPLPPRVAQPASVRVLVNGILVEERNLQ